MAQRVHIVLEDDIDGSEAAETIQFGLDDVSYEIDLSSKNASQLREALAPYVGVARRVAKRGGRGARGGRSRSTSGTSPSQVREWARAHGYEVSDRGRVSGDVQAAYDAAH